MEFSGFREEAFAFFRELRQNNSAAWFEEHEEVFREHVRVPFDQLLRTLDEPSFSARLVRCTGRGFLIHRTGRRNASPQSVNALVQRRIVQ